MRLRQFGAVSALCAALAAAVALTTAPATPASPVPPSLAFKASIWIGVDYRVTWAEGRRGTAPCEYWTTVDGTNEFVATNEGSRSKPLQAQVHVRRPSQVSDVVPWATIVAVGKAHGHVTRERDVDGGYTAGCTSPSPAFRPPPDDCRTVDFRSLQVALLAGWADIRVPGGGITLDYTRDSVPSAPDPDNLASFVSPVIFVSVAYSRPPFSRCSLPVDAPEFPHRFAVRVADGQWAKLRTLRFGRNVPRSQREVVLRDEYAGRCTRTRPRGECAFELALTIVVRRTSP